MSRIDVIVDLTQKINAAEGRVPRDEVEIQRMKKLRSDLARAEQAARSGSEHVIPTMPHPPLYPEGLRARLGQYTAEVVQAWYDIGSWHYLIDVAPVPLVGTLRVNLSEAEAKEKIAEYSNQPPGPAYPCGATFNRRGNGGEIIDVLLDGATYHYRLLGSDGVITENELRDVLNAA